LYQKLREKGYLIKKRGSDYNMPTQRAMELKLFEIKETVITHSDGRITVNRTPKVTGKGQMYFVNKFLAEEAAV
jgi:anti-repressor protein